VLYIADDGRNQVLERLPNGSFRIVAGTGKAGFSGDGGSATRAELNMPRGMAIGRDGTLYFADTANSRIRAISPNGIISTVVGNGKYGWVRSGAPAHTATIVWPDAVTLGPDHRLYIADTGENEVLRLERNGTLTEIAGNRRYAGVVGVGGPAVHASPDAPTSLAFDRAGNLYIAGFAVKTLLMITPKGIMTLPAGIGTLYNEGGTRFTTAPDGTVLATTYLTIVRLTPHGMVKVFDFSKPIDGITGFLPEGIAVAPNGDIYADTWYGNGYANKTALIVMRPGGKPRLLWEGK
jgi:streptogramin lyase